MDWTLWTDRTLYVRRVYPLVNIDRLVQRQQQRVFMLDVKGIPKYKYKLLIFNVNVWFWFHSVRKIVEISCLIWGFVLGLVSILRT